MKFIVNICFALAMVGAAHWTFQNMLLSPSAPIGGNGNAPIDQYQGELETFRQAK